MPESINDLAVSTLAEIASAKRVMDGVNDYGEVTGFCDEIDIIVEDLHRTLGSIRCRAARLKSRVQKHKEAPRRDPIPTPNPPPSGGR